MSGLTRKIKVERIIPRGEGKPYYVQTPHWEGYIPQWAIKGEGWNWIEIQSAYAKKEGVW